MESGGGEEGEGEGGEWEVGVGVGCLGGSNDGRRVLGAGKNNRLYAWEIE